MLSRFKERSSTTEWTYRIDIHLRVSVTERSLHFGWLLNLFLLGFMNHSPALPTIGISWYFAGTAAVG